MRKTARPVVWEGAGAQSPSPDPIVSSAGYIPAPQMARAMELGCPGGVIGHRISPNKEIQVLFY